MTNSHKVFIFWFKFSGQYDSLKSLLIEDGWQILVASSSLSLAEFSGGQGKLACLAILNPFNYVFSPMEVRHIYKFLACGNSLIIAGGDNESGLNKTNSNQILSPFGIKFNHDCVIRPNPYELYHPKDAQLEDFIANRGLADTLKKYTTARPSEDSLLKVQDGPVSSGPRIIYSQGCTLTVNTKLSTIMMTSSRWAIPSGLAICAFHRDDEKSSRLIALGSASLMSDSYIDAEDNKSLVRTLLEFITYKNFPINISDAKTIEIPTNNTTADVSRLIDTPISCLQESEPLPDDKSSLVDRKLFNLDNSMLPKITRAFHDLDVPHERLTLIKPKLDLHSLELEPATHGFLLRPFKH